MMNLLAHDADDGSLYKITVETQELIQLLRTEFPNTVKYESDSQILANIKSMTPEDIDGVILGTLQNQNKVDYSVKLMGVMDLGQGVSHFDD